MDDRADLVADGTRALVCWGERCLADLDDPASTVARPASPAEPPETVVADRVCSGARCDRLGPRLRAVVADADAAGSQLSATHDHAAIVIRDRGDSFQVWNRAGDRQVDLGRPTDDEGEIVSVDVIGDFLIVARACNEFCSSIARIIDARGHRHGNLFALSPGWGGEGARVVGVDADHFLAFGLFGELTLIAHGRVIASADLMPEHARQPHATAAHVVRLEDHTLAAAWCTGFAPDEGCHLTRISIDDGSEGSRPEITLDSDRPLPACPSEK
jgi:hypothetical protein